MKRSIRTPLALFGLLLALVIVSPRAVVRGADDSKVNSSPDAKAPGQGNSTETNPRIKTGQLSPYYSKVGIDSIQTATIDQIESDYARKIDVLRRQIEQIAAQRNREIREVLTPDQLKKLDEMDSGPKANQGKPADAYSYVKVSGKVTYSDGTAIPAFTLKLTFIAENPFPAPNEKAFVPKGKANTDKDGSFDVETSHFYGDGLKSGKHKVQVIPFDDHDQPIAGLVPQEYRDAKTTPLEIDTADVPLAIRIKRPSVAAAPKGS